MKVVSESDQGLYDAMNKGIARASGDIVGILNADDFYAHNQVLEKVARLFQKPEVQAVYGDLDYIHPLKTDRVVRKWRSGHYRRAAFLYGWMPPHPTFFVRKALYKDYGVFDRSFQTAADYELMLRFLYKYKVKVAYLPEVLVKMRTGGQSNADFFTRIHANREDRRAWSVNDLQPYFFTTWLKPLRKLRQFL